LVAYLGSRRYIRAGYDFSGTHGAGTPTAITVYRGHARTLNNG
jgi:hypothetical protein